MENYYTMTSTSKTVRGCRVYQIKALVDLPHHKVNKGDLGGWIEDYNSLKDGAWVSQQASVMNDGRVFEEAHVSGHAIIDNSSVFKTAHVRGWAIVENNSSVYGNAYVMDHSTVNNSTVAGNVVVSDHAIVHKAELFQNVKVRQHALVGEEYGKRVTLQDQIIVQGRAHISGPFTYKGSYGLTGIDSIYHPMRMMMMSLITSQKQVDVYLYRQPHGQYRLLINGSPETMDSARDILNNNHPHLGVTGEAMRKEFATGLDLLKARMEQWNDN